MAYSLKIMKIPFIYLHILDDISNDGISLEDNELLCVTNVEPGALGNLKSSEVLENFMETWDDGVPRVTALSMSM